MSTRRCSWLLALSLCRFIAVGATDVKSEPFVLQEAGLSTTSDDVGETCNSSSQMPFDLSWLYGHINEDALARLDVGPLPEYLPLPSFVRVYSYKRDANEEHTVSLSELARAARRVIDSDLSEHGAVLLRNLNERISTASDFAEFWKSVHEGCDAWKPTKLLPRFAMRPTLEGLDLVGNAHGNTTTLLCHNENISNPKPFSRVALYCFEPAREGGETLLVKNAQLTQDVRTEIQDLVREAGGIFHPMTYVDRDGPITRRGLSWQAVTGSDDKEEAVRFFISAGFEREDLSFDENGTLTVRSLKSGFMKDPNTGDEIWYNRIKEWFSIRPDGTEFPWDDVVQAQFDEWAHVSAFKLKKGDWLVVDNHKVQHGRLPFVNDPDGTPRTIVVVYTE